jgi:hypothetical protein
MGGLRQIYPWRVERPKRLEGSRFARWQLYELVSRRLPGTSRGVAVYRSVVSAHGTDAGQNIALGHSREPPAANP